MIFYWHSDANRQKPQAVWWVELIPVDYWAFKLESKNYSQRSVAVIDKAWNVKIWAQCLSY